MKFNYDEIKNIINNYKKSHYLDMNVVKQIIDKITNGSRVSISFFIAQLDKEESIDYNSYKIIKESISDFAIKNIDRYSYNEEGFNVLGYDENGFDKDGYDEDGYDADGYDKDGFDKDGYDEDGYDENGFDEDGYDADGFDENGFNVLGYDENGFDKDGYDPDGYDPDGYDPDGFGEDGFDENGFDADGYDPDGFDKDGYDKDGFDKDGFDKDGFDKDVAVDYNQESSKIPKLNNKDEELELISGVKKNGSYYIVVHGKSFDDVKSFVKIPDSIIEEYINKTNKNDIASVIAFAIKYLQNMI